MDGLVGASPSVCNRIREDSLAKEYIPQVGLSKRRPQKKRSNRSRSRKKKPTSKDSNATDKSSTASNVEQDELPKDSKPNSDKTSKSEKKRKRREKKNKKRLEKIREQNPIQSNEIVLMDTDEMTREPVKGDTPASVKDGDVTTSVLTNASPSKAEPHQALQERGEPVEQKQDQEQSAASLKCSTKSSLANESLLKYVTPAQDTKSPPASPTSKVFCIPPNAETIKTLSPAGKRAQAK